MSPTIYANYGLGLGDKACQARLDLFIEKALLLPEDAALNDIARMTLPSFVPLMRVSVWYCDDDIRYYMTEPDGAPAVTAENLDAWGLPWLRVPMQYGPHGNGATTLLFVSPNKEDALRAVSQRMGVSLRTL